MNFQLSSSAPNHDSLEQESRISSLGRSLGNINNISSSGTQTSSNATPQIVNQEIPNVTYSSGCNPGTVVFAPNDPIYSNSNFSTSSPIFMRVINLNKASNPISLQSQFWENDSSASACYACDKSFNLFVRRHHCRRCGLIYCDSCSSSRLPLKNTRMVYDVSGSLHNEEDEPMPQRVCDACYKIIRSGPRIPPIEVPVPLKRTDSQLSILTECPVCSKRLIAISSSKEEQEKHISNCLEGNSYDNAHNSSRYLVFTPDNTSNLLGQECTICFEEFGLGERIARLNCLCCFHRNCIQEWFFQNTSCPVHFK